MNKEEFINSCRNIAHVFGKDSQGHVVESYVSDRKIYEDSRIRITICTSSDEMEVEDLETFNPCLMVRRSGKEMRWDEKACLLYEHVDAIVFSFDRQFLRLYNNIKSILTIGRIRNEKRE